MAASPTGWQFTFQAIFQAASGMLAKSPRALDRIAKLPAIDRGECVYREKEPRACGMPLSNRGAQRSARHDVVDVGMVLKGAPPCMQHAEESKLIAEVEARLADQRPNRLAWISTPRN